MTAKHQLQPPFDRFHSRCNSVIAGTSNSGGVFKAVKRQLLSDTKFHEGAPDLTAADVRNASRRLLPAAPTLGLSHGAAMPAYPVFKVSFLMTRSNAWPDTCLS